MSIYCPFSEALGIETSVSILDYSDTDDNSMVIGAFRGKKHTKRTKKLMSESQQKRVERGDHVWCGSGEFQRNIQHNRILDGTHNFLGGELQRKRLREGTHIFLSKDFQKEVAVRNKEIQKRIVERGTHHLQNKPIVTCPHCGKIGDNSNMKRWHFDNCKKKGTQDATL